MKDDECLFQVPILAPIVYTTVLISYVYPKQNQKLRELINQCMS